MIGRATFLGFLALLVGVLPGWGGSYSGITTCAELTGCVLGRPKADHPLCDIDPDPGALDCVVTPFGITHPLGYTGSETLLEVEICVEADDTAKLEPAVLRAIALWESLAPTTNNCQGCRTFEEGGPPRRSLFAYPFVLHELGHCAMGLHHVNRLWDVEWDGKFEDTSFTLSAEAAFDPNALDAGTDGIRGSRDDFHRATLGGEPAESVSWFRRDDNDPFIVDPATAIDSISYSRSLSNLPGPEHRWGTSANRVVGELLGYTDSQSVMYSGTARDAFYTALSADDVNMVKMGMTGADLAANTPDDYTIDLVYVGDCSTAHDVRVHLGPTEVIAGCGLKQIDYSFDPGNPFLARHFSLVQSSPPVAVRVILNEDLPWVFEDPATVIFADSFESGDAGAWTAVFPLDQSNKGP